MDNEVNLVEAKRNFFNKLQRKNKVNKSRIEDLDIDSIGVVLNYQQIDLMNHAWDSDIKFESYKNNLLPYEEYCNKKTDRKRHLMILDNLRKDIKIPEKIKEIFDKIYEQTINNNKITDSIFVSTMDKLTTKLSSDLQYHIFNKVNSLYRVSYPGIKEMTIDETRRLYSNINRDFTSITIKDICSYKSYVNFNGSYNRDDLERVLKFCYDNDKQVKIKDLISYNNFPGYLMEQPKEIVKQKILTYVDDLTRYIKNYNVIHTRTDRKNFISSIDILSDLITDKEPFIYRGNLNSKEEAGILSILSFEDILDIISVAKKNLSTVSFCYNENGLEDKRIRNIYKEVLKAINTYEEKNNIKLIDEIGIKMHVDLDVLNDDIIDMFNDLSELKMPISITEFDLHATIDMINNNTSSEIEILRERFISDLCNIITNLKVSKVVNFNSFTIDSVNDKQNDALIKLNELRKLENKDILLTIYGGYYNNDMEKKESEEISLKFSESGGIDFFYGAIILVAMALIITAVTYLFMRII